MRSSNTIINEIKVLLNELEVSLGGTEKKSKNMGKIVKTSEPKGALGAISLLVEEKFFDTPKNISQVMERLTEIGHYHQKTAVSMNLLNLVKRRTFNRFKNKETKKWEYVTRR